MTKARTTLKLYIERNQSRFAGHKEDVLTWDNGEQNGGLAIQCDKNDYQGVLAGLEGITGKKAVDSTTLTVKN